MVMLGELVVFKPVWANGRCQYIKCVYSPLWARKGGGELKQTTVLSQTAPVDAGFLY